MAVENQALTDVELSAIRAAISANRFNTYLRATGHDVRRALNLYLWNAQIGESFHLPIQAFEIALRNQIDLALTRLYTPNWWECAALERILDSDRQIDLKTVIRRIRNRNLELCVEQVIAGLSMGFWVGLLDGRYNAPIWSTQLRIAFPHLPTGRSRKSLFAEAGKIATLRNRISHHEPLIGRNLSADFASIMQFLEWMSPATANWIRPHCRFATILRERP